MRLNQGDRRIKLYIDKGNEKQIMRNLTQDGYPPIRFEARRDHLGRWQAASFSQTRLGSNPECVA
jgi:hypothetical protein